jgi:Zn-dependent protease
VSPDVATGLAFFAVFLFSTTLHEAAHAWAALRGGDPTAYHGGQVSLDPIPHIRREPFGMIVLPLVTSVTMGWPMGYASAPYDPRWALRYPRRAALMALAGPAANLLLVLLCFAAMRGLAASGLFYPPSSVNFGQLTATDAGAVWSTVGHFLSIGFSLNLLLCVFNLLPFPPLDGSAAITLLMSRRMTTRYQMWVWGTPLLGFLGIFIAWQLFPPVFGPVFRIAINLIYPGVTYG